jgi:serine/threonine protein kinase
VVSGATATGVIKGTVAYMSPEQARGLPVGMQTDIWALGCVMFEMLTGRRAFSGATGTDILAAVVTRDPDWQILPAAIPPAVRSLVRQCLQKDTPTGSITSPTCGSISRRRSARIRYQHLPSGSATRESNAPFRGFWPVRLQWRLCACWRLPELLPRSFPR